MDSHGAAPATLSDEEFAMDRAPLITDECVKFKKTADLDQPPSVLKDYSRVLSDMSPRKLSTDWEAASS